MLKMWTMKKIQSNVQITEDVFPKFQRCRDTFGHGNGWAIVSAALRAFLSLPHAEQVSAIRSEHDRDMAEKLTRIAPSDPEVAKEIDMRKPPRGNRKRGNGEAG